MPAVAPFVLLLGELDGAIDRTAARAFGGRAAGRLTEFGSVLARGSSSHAAAELRSCNAIAERRSSAWPGDRPGCYRVTIRAGAHARRRPREGLDESPIRVRARLRRRPPAYLLVARSGGSWRSPSQTRSSAGTVLSSAGRRLLRDRRFAAAAGGADRVAGFVPEGQPEASRIGLSRLPPTSGTQPSAAPDARNSFGAAARRAQSIALAVCQKR